MSVPILIVLLVFLLLASYCDLIQRRVPNAMIVAWTVFALIGAFMGWMIFHGVWALLAMAIMRLAKIPWGDTKGFGVIALYLGYLGIIALLLSLFVAIVIWIGYHRHWWCYPGNIPFFPLISCVTYGTVLAAYMFT